MNNTFDIFEELNRIANNHTQPANAMEECKYNLDKLERMLRTKK